MTNELQTPLVIILDIDGTVVGDITPQVMLYELHTAVKDKDFKVNIKHFENQLRLGIVRPYLNRYVKKMMTAFDGKVEFFVYTAAEKKWSNFLIPRIEKVLDVKFNRPIFTRDDCHMINGECKKNIFDILPKITKTLRKKYGNIDKSSLQDKVIIIDNNASVYDVRSADYLIECPTYDFKLPENIPSSIDHHMFSKHPSIIVHTLGKFYKSICQTSQSDYIQFQIDFYKLYQPFLSLTHKHNSYYKNDKFFYYLANIIMYKGITQFNASTIKYIRKKIAKSVKE